MWAGADTARWCAGRDRPALTVQGPDLLIEGLPAGRALGGLLLGAWRGGWRWHRHRDRAVRPRHGLLAHRRIDGLKDVVMRGEDLVEDFGQVLEQMKTVCH